VSKLLRLRGVERGESVVDLVFSFEQKGLILFSKRVAAILNGEEEVMKGESRGR